MDPLAGDVLRREREAEDAVTGMGYLPFDIFPVVGKLIGELAADFQGPIMVLHNLQAAKDDDAVKKQRPAVIRRLRLLHHAEAGFLPAAHGVDLVPGHPAVEVELSVLRVIPMIDGKSIGVVSIAQNGENAPLLLFQDSDAFLWGERLFYPGNRAEGRGVGIQLFGQNGIKRQIAAGIAVVAAAVPDAS